MTRVKCGKNRLGGCAVLRPRHNVREGGILLHDTTGPLVSRKLRDHALVSYFLSGSGC